MAWWQVAVAAIVYSVLPYAVGSVLGWATRNDKPWARWLVGSFRHPRAWDYLWSRNRPLIVRIKLKSGDHLAGLYESSTSGIASYAAGYGEDADLYLSRQLKVDSRTGAFEVDEQGSPVLYDPPVGLLVRATDVELWNIQEVQNG